MNDERTITIVIDPMGNAKVDANNFTGGACVKASEPIEKALAGGDGIVVRSHKDGYHEHEVEATTQEITGFG